MTSRTGRRSPSRPSDPEDALEQARLATLGHGGQGRGRHAPARRRGGSPSSGRSRSSSSVAVPRTRASSSSASAARAGRSARTSGAVRRVGAGAEGAAAQDGIGSWSAPTRRIASSMKRVDADAGRAVEQQRRPSRRPAADWSTDASLANASSRPTNRALVYLAGMRHSSRRPRDRSPARLRCTA